MGHNDRWNQQRYRLGSRRCRRPALARLRWRHGRRHLRRRRCQRIDDWHAPVEHRAWSLVAGFTSAPITKSMPLICLAERLHPLRATDADPTATATATATATSTPRSTPTPTSSPTPTPTAYAKFYTQANAYCQAARNTEAATDSSTETDAISDRPRSCSAPRLACTFESVAEPERVRNRILPKRKSPIATSLRRPTAKIFNRVTLGLPAVVS